MKLLPVNDGFNIQIPINNLEFDIQSLSVHTHQGLSPVLPQAFPVLHRETELNRIYLIIFGVAVNSHGRGNT